MMSEKILGLAAGFAAAGIWGGMYVVSKVVLEVIPPFLLVSVRLVLGAGCLLILLAGLRGFKATRTARISALLVGVVGCGISLGLQFVGTKMSTAANASLVTSASPAFIFLFGALLLKENVTWARLVALTLGTVGVVAVVDPRAASFGGQLFWGNTILFGAALTWGLYSVLVKRVSAEVGVLELSLFAFLGGLLVSLPMGLAEWAGQGIGDITPGVILGVVYLGVVSTALATYLWNKSLALLDAGIVSLLFFAQPIVGGALGATVLHEQLTASYWIGAALIGAGLWVAARSEGMTRLSRDRIAQPAEER